MKDFRKFKVGDRVQAKENAGFHAGTYGNVSYVEPSGKNCWVRRDGASRDVFYKPEELRLTDEKGDEDRAEMLRRHEAGMAPLAIKINTHRKPLPVSIQSTLPEGMKFDDGKAPIRRGVLEYFPRAIIEIAKLSAKGAVKYDWGNWEKVHDAINRYGDAELRHICEAAAYGPTDEETGMLHAVHEAWCALAVLEKKLIENEKDNG